LAIVPGRVLTTGIESVWTSLPTEALSSQPDSAAFRTAVRRRTIYVQALGTTTWIAITKAWADTVYRHIRDDFTHRFHSTLTVDLRNPRCAFLIIKDAA